jgi:hypothetical protein
MSDPRERACARGSSRLEVVRAAAWGRAARWHPRHGAGILVRMRPDTSPAAARIPLSNGAMADSIVPRPDGSRLPERRLTTEQMEAAVRRAVELQALDADAASDAGVSEEELVRIGNELGISPAHMRRAMAEVTASGPPPTKSSERLFGPARTSASRTVPGNAEEVQRHIEKYLLDSQYLAVLRRLPDRTVYEKSGGFQVEMERVMDATRSVFGTGDRLPRIGAGFDMRSVRTVEVAVQPLEPGFCYVTMTVDLGNQRIGYWVGISTAAGVGTLGIAAVAAIAIAPPAALVGLPILGASAWGTRASYNAVVERARVHLEALLDHLERGESLLPGRAPAPRSSRS